MAISASGNEKPSTFTIAAFILPIGFCFAKRILAKKDPAVDPLITLRDAEARILASCKTLGTERVALADAYGRVLVESVIADRPLPPFRRAMMDGVAFQSKSAKPSTALKIAGLHAAGDPPPRELTAGEGWEIMTGAVVPDDCDVVLPYEDLADGFVLPASYESGQFIHPAGSDAAKGDVLLGDGSILGPAEIAIAASVGMSVLKVFARPRVGIISTGDEMVSIDATPAPWQIRRSNGPMLESILTRLGYDVVFHEHVSDERSSAVEMIEASLSRCDVLILSGGISKGKRDHVRSVLEERLGAPLLHGVMQRPGKPFACWSGPPLVFALPGNPVSVLATFVRHVLPALRKMEGGDIKPMRVRVSDITPLPKFSWLLPVTIGPNGNLVPTPPNNSGDYVSIAGSSGLIEVPPEPEFSFGQDFDFYPFP